MSWRRGATAVVSSSEESDALEDDASLASEAGSLADWLGGKGRRDPSMDLKKD